MTSSNLTKRMMNYGSILWGVARHENNMRLFASKNPEN